MYANTVLNETPMTPPTPDTATLDYARQMLENGRFDVVRRTLAPYPDHPTASAILTELEDRERTGRTFARDTPDSDGVVRRGNQVLINDVFVNPIVPIADLVARLEALRSDAQPLAPRWQRRITVDVAHQSEERADVLVKSLAKSPYEWRYVPTQVRLRLEVIDAEYVLVNGRVQAARRFVAAGVLAVVAALLVAVYVLSLNVTLTCGTSMVLMIGGFYLLPALMSHTSQVSGQLAQVVQAALHNHDIPPLEQTPTQATPDGISGATLRRRAAPLPLRTPLPADIRKLRQTLTALDGQRNTPAADWFNRLVVRQENDNLTLRFRVQAIPLQFWEWWWTPPDVAGRLELTADGTLLHLSENRRNDVLFMLIGSVLLTVGVVSTLVGAPIWARLLVSGAVLVSLALSYPIAQRSMTIRNAQLAAYVQGALSTSTQAADSSEQSFILE